MFSSDSVGCCTPGHKRTLPLLLVRWQRGAPMTWLTPRGVLLPIRRHPRLRASTAYSSSRSRSPARRSFSSSGQPMLCSAGPCRCRTRSRLLAGATVRVPRPKPAQRLPGIEGLAENRVDRLGERGARSCGRRPRAGGRTAARICRVSPASVVASCASGRSGVAVGRSRRDEAPPSSHVSVTARTSLNRASARSGDALQVSQRLKEVLDTRSGPWQPR